MWGSEPAMTHEEVVAHLPEYVTSTLDEGSADQVVEHLSSCSDCSDAADTASRKPRYLSKNAMLRVLSSRTVIAIRWEFA